MRSVLLGIAVVGIIAGSAMAQNYPSGAGPSTAQTAPAPTAQSAPPPSSTSEKATAGATANVAPITTAAQAKSRIESSGFTNVSSLMKDRAGIWHGTAMKDGMPVRIALDVQGNVGIE